MQVDSKKLVSAGWVAPSEKLYAVVLPFDHKTLKEGDLVRMAEVEYNNVLVRASDLSVHPLQAPSGDYVILAEKGLS